MSSFSNTTTLTESQLEAWLDEVDKLIEQQQDDELPEKSLQDNLSNMLKQYQYAPDTINSVYRLFKFWLLADDAAEAMRTLEEDGDKILKTLADEDCEYARVNLAFWRTEVLEASQLERVPEALETVEKLLKNTSDYKQRGDVWSHLAQRAQVAGAFELERRCAEELLALKQASPERKDNRAWDIAMLSAQHAQSYSAQGNTEQVLQSCETAIKKLAEADADQDIDYKDWLNLGDMLIKVSPDTYEKIELHTAKQLAKSTSPAVRRDMEVQLARLEARSLYQKGKLKEALKKGKMGHFDLVGDEDDSFTALLLDWYKEDGQLDEAAELAFESAFCCREVSSVHACHIALEHMSEAKHKNIHWSLLLAYACNDENLQSIVCSESDATAQYNSYMELAKQCDPEHPLIDLVIAEQLYNSKDYSKALHLLEAAVKKPQLSHVFHADFGEMLWMSRIKVYGAKKACKLSFFELDSGGWCYSMGVDLNDDEMKEFVSDKEEWPEEKFEALATRYYELGLVKFERFFKKGTGTFRNGDIHTYSMLCNNLAIDYRYDQDRYKDAVKLHKKGIAASPFAEHYCGLLRCQEELENWEGYVSAAEDLWQYAAEYGYGRHEPAEYIWQTSNLLANDLGRPHECSIWLQRLTGWWESLEEEEQAEHQDEYWSSLAIVLRNVGATQPDDALALMEVALPDIVAQNSTEGTRLAACFFEELGHPEKAIPLFQQAITQARSGNKFDKKQSKQAADSIKLCNKMLKNRKAKKPWWKL